MKYVNPRIWKFLKFLLIFTDEKMGRKSEWKRPRVGPLVPAPAHPSSSIGSEWELVTKTGRRLGLLWVHFRPNEDGMDADKKQIGCLLLPINPWNKGQQLEIEHSSHSAISVFIQITTIWEYRLGMISASLEILTFQICIVWRCYWFGTDAIIGTYTSGAGTCP